MSETVFAVLEDRAVVAAAGADARTFLQGLVSNDVTKVAPGRAVYAALLTPQGKFLFDFFLVDGGPERLLLDVEAARAGDFVKRLKLYKLRSKVEIAPVPDLCVVAVWGADASRARDKAGAYADPRLADAGVRAIVPADGARADFAAAGFTDAGGAAYDRHRLSLALPDGSRDIEVDKAVLLECGFEELNGVDFDKGCYMGQELTARTKYRGLVKKRLLPVAIEGDAPKPGTKITLDGRDAGELRSAQGAQGLALIRLDALDQARRDGLPLMAGAAALAAWTPAWMKLPETGDEPAD